jgi:thioesterase domain-containing protein
MAPLLEELRRTWHTGIPISAAMDVRPVAYDDGTLAIQAALEPNINVHGTAFAGSLYAICALACWGAIWLQLRQRGLTGSILLAQAHISYTRPVAETLHCQCRFDPVAQQAQLLRLTESGKSRFVLESEILVQGQSAVRFEGRFAVRC